MWGTPCDQISADWGAQRVKSLSVGKALLHALLKPFRRASAGGAQQTSLIERFLYPKTGPGLMWETTADRLRARGLRLQFESPVTSLEHQGGRIVAAVVRRADGSETRYEADSFITTMPVRDLVLGLAPAAPTAPREIASGLEYRDFITVGLLYRRLARDPVPDNWIYVQEGDVRVGR